MLVLTFIIVFSSAVCVMADDGTSSDTAALSSGTTPNNTVEDADADTDEEPSVVDDQDGDEIIEAEPETPDQPNEAPTDVQDVVNDGPDAVAAGSGNDVQPSAGDLPVAGSDQSVVVVSDSSSNDNDNFGTPVEASESDRLDQNGDDDNGQAADEGNEVHKEIVVPAAPTVNIIDTNFCTDETYTSEDGTVVVMNFLHRFDENASGFESMTVYVNGIAYYILSFSDGSIETDLPEGFEIIDGNLYISGIFADLNILIEDHGAVSGISCEPEEEFYGYIAPSQPEEKTDISTPAFEEPVLERDEENRSVQSAFAGNAAYDFVPAPELAAVIAEPKKLPEKKTVIPAEPEEAHSEVLGAYAAPAGNRPKAVLVAAFLAVMSLAAFALKQLGFFLFK